jgi:hypothetical protein
MSARLHSITVLQRQVSQRTLTPFIRQPVLLLQSTILPSQLDLWGRVLQTLIVAQVVRKIFRMLRNSKLHYSGYKYLLLDAILSQLNPLL